MVGELKVFSRYRETYKGLKSFEVLKVSQRECIAYFPLQIAIWSGKYAVRKWLLGCFTHHFDLYASFYYLCNVVIELQYRSHR